MTRPVKVFALVTDAYGGRGGIAQYNRDFLGSLAERGLAESITVLPRHTADQVATPRGIRQLSPHRSRIGYVLSALKAASTQPIDVVFCGHLHLAVLAVIVARLGRARLLVQTHGTDAWVRPPALRRRAIEAADLILCVSRYTRAAVLNWASMAPERAVVLPNTVGEVFAPGDDSAMRAAMGLAGKRVLLTVGRLDSRERQKGHDRVIAAIPDLVARGHDVIYAIAGEGDDRARLEQYANEIGVAGRVRFLGPVPLETLTGLYRMADLFVMPSTQEGFGIAFLEAMASGTPALGLASSGAVDALADGELGETIAEADLVPAIDRLLTALRRNPEELAAAVRTRYGRARFADNVGRLVSRLMDPR